MPPLGEERRGANLRDRFRQRLAGFVPMEWLLNTHRELGRLQTHSRRDSSDIEAGAVRRIRRERNLAREARDMLGMCARGERVT